MIFDYTVAAYDSTGLNANSPLFTGCEGQDSNLHIQGHWNLNPARLPIPPPSLTV